MIFRISVSQKENGNGSLTKPHGCRGYIKNKQNNKKKSTLKAMKNQAAYQKGHCLTSKHQGFGFYLYCPCALLSYNHI